MADKSFGVKELNLLNASGTPTVTSPNNLNLNANTVAISTSCTIGNNLTITSTTTSANLNISGIATVVNFNATGISTIAQPADSNPMANWTITNNSASAYRFTGPGQSGTEDNPNIYLVRGHRYIFRHNATGSHPIQIRVSNGGSAYTDGITYSEGNNTTTDGNNLTFNVQHDAPAQLFYQCTAHGGMVGNIYIVGGPQVISGVVTATTFVGNLTGNVTGTASANAVLTGSTNNTLVTVTGANAITGESNLTFNGGATGDAQLTVHAAQNDSGADSELILETSNDFATSVVMFKDSTAEAGSIAYNHGDNYIKLSTDGTNGGTEKLRITDGGNLMLRSSAANYLVLGTGGDSGFGASISNNMNWIRGNQDNLQMNTATGGFMGFEIGGSEKFRIGSSGQYGIGGGNYGTAGQVIKSTGASSAPVWASGGRAIQYSSDYKTAEQNTSSSSWQTISGLARTVTPKNANSRFLLLFMATGQTNGGRISLDIEYSATGITDDRIGNSLNEFALMSSEQTSGQNIPLHMHWVHHPNTANAVTYTPKFRGSGSNTVIIGASNHPAHFTVIELEGF